MKKAGASLPLVFGTVAGCVPIISMALGVKLGMRADLALIYGYGIAAIPYLILWTTFERLPSSRNTLRTIICLAAIVRLINLSMPPLLSEDLWRYIWDGMTYWQGINPFHYAPAAREFDVLNLSVGLDEVRRNIGHAHIPTIYPPGAQMVFQMGTFLGPSQTAMRLTMIVGDLFAICVLWKLASRLKQNPCCAALYAFLPLSILESSVGGHVDSVGVLCLLFTAYMMSCQRAWLAGLGMALAGGIKLVPLALLPKFYYSKRRFFIGVIGTVLVIFGVWYFQYQTYPKGLVAYAHKWRGNDGLFALFNGGFSFVLHDTVDWINSGTTVRNLITILIGRDHGALVTIEHVSFAASKLLAIGAVGSAILWATLYARDISSCWLIFMGCLLLTSPIVHPWYLLWVAPFASLYASNLNPWFSRGLITWCLLIWIAYLPRPKYLVTGVWEEQPILRLVQYFPVWTCILFGLYEVLKQRTSPGERH